MLSAYKMNSGILYDRVKSKQSKIDRTIDETLPGTFSYIKHNQNQSYLKSQDESDEQRQTR